MQGVAESSKGHHKSAKVKLQDPGAGSGITVIHEEYRSEPGKTYTKYITVYFITKYFKHLSLTKLCWAIGKNIDYK